MLPHSAQAFGPWETDLLPPQKCNMFVSRRGLETTGAGTFKTNSCTTELLVTGRTHPQLPTTCRPTFLLMMNVFYPFVPICLFAFLPSADCTTELLCRKEVQQLMAGWWDLPLCTWRLAANAVSAAVGFPLRCVFHEFDSHCLNVPVASAVQISWLLGHLLLYANDISFFHWPGMQLMLIHIYIYTMTQNLNLLFLFWSVSLATITRRLVKMDSLWYLYIYLTQSDESHGSHWQPRNVLDMQALQRVHLGPSVFKDVAVFPVTFVKSHQAVLQVGSEHKMCHDEHLQREVVANYNASLIWPPPMVTWNHQALGFDPTCPCYHQRCGYHCQHMQF